MILHYMCINMYISLEVRGFQSFTPAVTSRIGKGEKGVDDCYCMDCDFPRYVLQLYVLLIYIFLRTQCLSCDCSRN